VSLYEIEVSKPRWRRQSLNQYNSYGITRIVDLATDALLMLMPKEQLVLLAVSRLCQGSSIGLFPTFRASAERVVLSQRSCRRGSDTVDQLFRTFEAVTTESL
jgi:hypothetical protein